MSVMRDAAWNGILGALLLAGCQDAAPAGWSGTERDSAGILIVENTTPAGWPGSAPTLTEELRIGSVDGAETAFGGVAGLAVRSDGTILVLDAQARSIRVFSAAGRPSGTLGGPGTGPGELRGAFTMVLVRDTLVVPDMSLQRVNTYPPDGPPGSFPLQLTDGIPVQWAGTTHGTLMTQVRMLPLPGVDMGGGGDLIIERNLAGQVTDTVLELPRGESYDMSGLVPGGAMPRFRVFAAEPVWAINADGWLAFANNAHYRIHVLDPAGNLVRIVARAVTPRPVTDRDRETFGRVMSDMLAGQGMPGSGASEILSNVDFAETYPALGKLMFGPGGTLWVQRALTLPELEAADVPFDPQSTGGQEWDVFDAAGRLRGSVTLPGGFSATVWHDGALYGVQVDELDVQYVVRLRVDGPPIQ
ncbi:MAG: hypothetical protein WEA24_13400 [Gemmatimonadota bacterium]